MGDRGFKGKQKLQNVLTSTFQKYPVFLPQFSPNIFLGMN